MFNALPAGKNATVTGCQICAVEPVLLSSFANRYAPSQPVSVVAVRPESALDPDSIQSCASPGHLQAVAYLYGVNTVDIEQAKVLELGCGQGSGLCAYAQTWPGAHFVGIDILPEAVNKAQVHQAALGVSNIDFVCTTLEQLLAADLGEFDYILVHGVFALIQGEGRSALMAFCQRHLSPSGLVYFAYSTLPGGKMDELVSDAIQLHTSQALSSQEQVAGARAMLAFLADGLDKRNPLAAMVRKYATQLEKESDQSLLLKYFEGLGRPAYVLDILSQAQQSQLSYVGDAEPHIEVLASYGETVEQFNQTINPSANQALGLQYLDFSALRSVRHSLFVRADYQGEIFAEPDLSRLKDLRWAFGVRRVLTDTDAIGNGFITAEGGVIGTEDTLMLRLLDIFAAAWPTALSTEQLCLLLQDAPGLIDQEAVPLDVVLGLLERLFMQATPVQYYLRESPRSASDKLQPLPALALALQQDSSLEDGSFQAVLSNIWHEQILLGLTAQEHRLLRLLDGKTGLVSLRQSLNEPEWGVLLTCLLSLHHQGLLAGGDEGRLALFQALLGRRNASQLQCAMYAYALLIHALPPAQGGWSQKGVVLSALQAQEQDPDLMRRFKPVIQAFAQGDTQQALALSRELTGKYPTSVLAWQSRARVSLESGVQDGGIAYALQALSLHHRSMDLYLDLVLCLWRNAYVDSAERLLLHVLAVNPEYGTGWDILSLIFQAKNQLHYALKSSQKAVHCVPDGVKILTNMANILTDLSRWKEAAQVYRQAIALAPESYFIRSNLLFLLTQDEAVSKQDLFQEHLEFGALLAKRNGKQAARSSFKRNAEKKWPRIGFISGDLRKHAVSNFFQPVLQSLKQSSFEIFIYNNNPRDDEETAALRAYGNTWRAITALSDGGAARQIRADEIDILVDLSGHTGHNRLPLLSRRVAPIQASWIGYPATTGLNTMDYYIHYAGVGIGDLDDQFTEKLVYLPRAYGFQAYGHGPDVNELPMRTKGHITFGSFNRPSKVGAQTVELWASVLKAIPSAHMLIGAIMGQEMKNDFLQRFVAQGIEAERLHFVEREPLQAYLERHHEVDILLDSYPYGGGTTTHYAAWMGVPTLTLAGPTLAGRSGMVLMNQYELPDFVAYSAAQLVELAVAWSNREDELAAVRAQLRPRLQKGDEHVSLYLERAFMAMWQRWQDGLPPASIEIPA